MKIKIKVIGMEERIYNSLKEFEVAEDMSSLIKSTIDCEWYAGNYVFNSIRYNLNHDVLNVDYHNLETFVKRMKSIETEGEEVEEVEIEPVKKMVFVGNIEVDSMDGCIERSYLDLIDFIEKENIHSIDRGTAVAEIMENEKVIETLTYKKKNDVPAWYKDLDVFKQKLREIQWPHLKEKNK